MLVGRRDCEDHTFVTNDDFTIGVEEEYQIIDPATRELLSRAHLILATAQDSVGDSVQFEHYLSQIEIGTAIARSVPEVRSELTRLRREVIAAAERNGGRIAAAGTHPFSHWGAQEMTPKARYIEVAEDQAQLSREQLIFGCHVHIGISDRDSAIEVMNRSRPWLAVMLALAANSPYWLGTDTGYSSFRTEMWSRWPTAGTPHPFSSRADFDNLVLSLQSTGTISDGTKIYWDMRPSARFETIEFRVTDVCMTVDEAVMIAGLARGLARTCYDEAIAGEPSPQVRPELLRAAKWQAARYGLGGKLIDLDAMASVPAAAMVESLLVYVRPALENYGEWDEVAALARGTVERGSAARRQREIFARNQRLEDVVDFVIAETARG
jgi:glutamate---cysteine ligase / carboxylate-amine ligase